MNKEDVKDVILQILELQLDYQLRAIRQLQGKPEIEPAFHIRRGRRCQSLVDLSVQLLTEKRKPLHVNELAGSFSSASDVLPTGIPCQARWQRRHARAFWFVRALLPPSRLSIPRRITMTQPDLQLLAQWLDPECGVLMWMEYELDANYNVVDVYVYI